MKRLILSACILLTALAAASCADDALNSSYGEGFGHIRLRGSANGVIETLTRAEFDLSTIGVTVPAPGEFSLKLTSTALAYSNSWPSIDAFNAEDELYTAGTYTAVVSYGSPYSEGVNKPYYEGSKDLTVVATETTTVQIPAAIANSLAEIRTTEAFDNYFHDATFTIKTASGNSFTFTPGSSQKVVPVFVRAGTKLTVSGTARRQSQTGEDDGPEITFSEQTLDKTVARTRHIFTFDAADAGSATLHITLDENQEIVVTVDIELNENA